MNQVYVMMYHHWSKLLLVEFTPYVLMIVLNCLIWRRVRAMVRMRYDVGLAAGELRFPQKRRCFGKGIHDVALQRQTASKHLKFSSGIDGR